MLALTRHLRAFLRREFSHGPDGSFDYGDIGDNAPHSSGLRSLMESALEPSEYGKAMQKSSDSVLRWAAQAPRISRSIVFQVDLLCVQVQKSDNSLGIPN